jgi:hypothetical protein
MYNVFNASPNPLQCFSSDIQRAIREVVAAVEMPIEMAYGEFLANMSAVAQGLYDVRLPYGKKCPISIYTLTIGDTGERKSALNDAIAEPMSEFDKQCMADYEEQLTSSQTAIDIWLQKKKGLGRLLAKLVALDKPTDEIEERLRIHELSKPVKPYPYQLRFQDTSERALIDALEGEGRSLFITAPEGHVTLSTPLFAKPGKLNQGWSGETLMVDRRGEKKRAIDCRITSSISIQEKLWDKEMKKNGEILRASGYFARCLVCKPHSRIGTRFNSSAAPMPNLTLFHDQLRHYLQRLKDKWEVGKSDRILLEFSPEAQQVWHTYSNHIESKLGPGRELHSIRDFGAKMMENASRIAALFHVFSKREGAIQSDILHNAVTLMEWYAIEYKKVFPSESQEIMDAKELLKHLWRRHGEGYSTYWPKNEILNNGPPSLRTKARLDPALEVLIHSGHVRLYVVERNQKVIWYLYPRFWDELSDTSMINDLPGNF